MGRGGGVFGGGGGGKIVEKSQVLFPDPIPGPKPVPKPVPKPGPVPGPGQSFYLFKMDDFYSHTTSLFKSDHLSLLKREVNGKWLHLRRGASGRPLLSLKVTNGHFSREKWR